jgi:hypothetical protein
LRVSDAKRRDSTKSSSGRHNTSVFEQLLLRSGFRPKTTVEMTTLLRVSKT